MTIKLVVFDLDGTLVASLEGIRHSMNQVLKRSGYPLHSMDRYRLYVGDGLKKVVERSLPQEHRHPDHIDEIYKELLSVYSTGYHYKLRLYPGIAETLDGLVQRKIRLAVNTNKNQNIAQQIVDLYMDRWPILQVAGSVADRSKKPDPAGLHDIMDHLQVKPFQTIYVGDTPVDLQTARNAGVACVVVTYGFRTREELMPFNPEFFVDSPLEILGLIDKWNGPTHND